MTTQERLRQVIIEIFYLSDRDELTHEVSLISSGIVDSTGMLDVILSRVRHPCRGSRCDS